MFRTLLLSAIFACASSTIYDASLIYRPATMDSRLPVFSEVHKNGHHQHLAPFQYGTISRSNYLNKYTLLKNMENYTIDKLSKVTTKPPLNNSLRHYTLLMGLLLSIGKAFAAAKAPNLYDQIYLDTLDRMAPKVWKDPVSYARQVINVIKSAREATTTARNMLQFTCVAREYSGDACDMMVNFQLNRLPTSYMDSMKSLSTLSDVADMFSRHSKLFDRVSNDYSTIDFLINERKALRPLIFNIVKALAIVNSEKTNDCRF